MTFPVDRAQAIELLVMDVDGVLTDGSIIVGPDGREWKRFYVRDGAAVAYWRRFGKRTALLSGRSAEAVFYRAAELKIDRVIQGRLDKGRAIRELMALERVSPEQTCFIGDDLPDLKAMEEVGLAVAVADAVPEVQQAAHYVTKAAGGRGAVRELVELLLRAQGLWDRIMEIYEG